MPDFAQALALILKEEGGKVDDPRDPGGRTNKGITQRTYDAWRKLQGQSSRDVYDISDAETSAIYRKQYADAIRFDDLPNGVGYAVLDYAVNSGVSRAAKALQACLGVEPDGIVGLHTVAASRSIDAPKLIAMVCDLRLRVLKNLSTWTTFGKGWGNRVAHVRDNALLIAGTASPKPSLGSVLIDAPSRPPQRPVAPTLPPPGKPSPLPPYSPPVGPVATVPPVPKQTWGDWFKAAFFARRDA